MEDSSGYTHLHLLPTRTHPIHKHFRKKLRRKGFLERKKVPVTFLK